jgi:hypothetical protein
MSILLNINYKAEIIKKVHLLLSHTSRCAISFVCRVDLFCSVHMFGVGGGAQSKNINTTFEHCP